MNPKPQLVLDAGGVITANLSPSYWSELMLSDIVSGNSVVRKFKEELRESLWSGRVSEAEFYVWIRRQISDIDHSDEVMRRMLQTHLRLLPAAEWVAKWSEKANIHILSNHRHEWLSPVLAPLMPYITSCTISSEVGMCKPGAAIYNALHGRLEHSDEIYFVDDQERNLLPAREMGWETILADSAGQWTKTVNELLKC
ncbi:HAD-IA family hydrolase [Paenibacillus shunpengii]|uniref:HAD-IA family hydrolase n=1 Tax=Paenibacillus shunpengii TaxID=2054424 RepID=A0ABW5SK87_9BACL|nr:HAD-IA family hydrolase [Paenibacillus sp. PDC88]SDW34798.1 putative hydrolase of the HAD superfamily [Paenibacillus sp. PDC88]